MAFFWAEQVGWGPLAWPLAALLTAFGLALLAQALARLGAQQPFEQQPARHEVESGMLVAGSGFEVGASYDDPAPIQLIAHPANDAR